MDTTKQTPPDHSPSEMELALQKFMQSRFYRMLDGALSHRYHHWMMPIIGFIDALLIFIPTEVFVAVYALKHRTKRIVDFVGPLVLANTLGYTFNYLVGFYLGVQLYDVLLYLFSTESIAAVQQAVAGNIFVLSFMAAFTAVALAPLTLITFAAGIFGANLPLMLLAAILGRLLRYGLIAYISREYGMKVLERVFRDSMILFLIIVALLFYVIVIK